jgi:trehalose 6-phosphate synthase
VRGAARAGGLAVALVDALRSHQGLWFGWSGRVTPSGGGPVAHHEVDGITLATMDLSAAEHEAYYNGFANGCLWPLCHFRTDLAQFDRRQFESYLRTSARFAQNLHPLLREEDLVWVHDYHLFPLGEVLREMGCRQPIGFFLHTPFPPRELRVSIPGHETLVRQLFAYDLVGFQTKADVERLQDYVVHEMGGRVEGDRLHAFGRSVAARAFPIGIDADQFQAMAFSRDAEQEWRRVRSAFGSQEQIIGVDRLDYSKGLPQRFAAFEALLAEYPETRGRASLLQIAPVSREGVRAYRQLRDELEATTGRINARFAEHDWTPLRYLQRAVSRRRLAGLYRASRIGLVTPLRDGMNLVAKEYVAAQDPDDPGVLVLSRFAGAAEQMDAALLVNPHDVAGVTEALQTARSMPRAERRERYERLMRGLRRDNVGSWCQDFLTALEAQTPTEAAWQRAIA